MKITDNEISMDDYDPVGILLPDEEDLTEEDDESEDSDTDEDLLPIITVTDILW